MEAQATIRGAAKAAAAIALSFISQLSELVLGTDFDFPVAGAIFLEDILPLAIGRELISDLDLATNFKSSEGFIVASIGSSYTESTLNIRGEATSFPGITDATLMNSFAEIFISAFKFVLGLYIGSSGAREF